MRREDGKGYEEEEEEEEGKRKEEGGGGGDRTAICRQANRHTANEPQT